MERQKCKLCGRGFANAKALGGHMKAHLATLPLPPKTGGGGGGGGGGDDDSASSSSSSSGEEQEQEQEQEQESKSREVLEEKALVYGLRENPKKSFRFADPEFSFALDSGSVVQDRESETESRNPTRKRSRRNRKPVTPEGGKQNSEVKKLKSIKPSCAEFPLEPEPLSSISDTSPEEDVAMCLMMLSRDVWKVKEVKMETAEEEEEEEEDPEAAEIKLRKNRGRYRCEKCDMSFRSPTALGGHKRICSDQVKKLTFQCPFCDRVFGSGQALGGHKRSHMLPSNPATATATATATSTQPEKSPIDLNLPAPTEDDEFSVVSDA
ncbi:hypothetical protein SLA2020_458160 [Shorea laevis]